MASFGTQSHAPHLLMPDVCVHSAVEECRGTPLTGGVRSLWGRQPLCQLLQCLLFCKCWQGDVLQHSYLAST